MTKVTVRKYWSFGTFTDPVKAQTKVAELSEKYPARDYLILTNLRSSGRYCVVQYEDVTVNVPDREEILGPDPEPPQSPRWLGRGSSTSEWTDYEAILRKRTVEWQKALAPAMQALRGKLNP